MYLFHKCDLYVGITVYDAFNAFYKVIAHRKISSRSSYRSMKEGRFVVIT